MEIRRAAADDAVPVCHLLQILQEYHVQLRPDLFDPSTSPEDYLAEFRAVLDNSNETCFVATVNDQIVGTVTLVLERPTYPKFRKGLVYIRLQSLVVDPAYRRRGIAKALLKAGTEWAQQQAVATMWLFVWGDNLPAIRLYEEEGWSIVAQRMEYRFLTAASSRKE